jgi:hypothetical protein
VFAVAAVVFGLLAVVLFVRGSGSGIAPVPTAAPGGNQIVNVTDALEAQGLNVEQPPGLFIPRGRLATPGQGIEIDGQPAFIFLYPDAPSAQAAAEGADPNDVVPERLAGTPAPDGERRMVQGSNVIVLMIGGSPETWQKVETAVHGLR